MATTAKGRRASFIPYLWQVYECTYPNDPERHSAPGAVIEAFVEATLAGNSADFRLRRKSPQKGGGPPAAGLARRS